MQHVNIFKFVFYNLYAWKAKQLQDASEAAITAALFMVMPAISLVVTADAVVASLFGIGPMYRYIGMFPYFSACAVVLYSVHHYWFVPRRKRDVITRDYANISVGKEWAKFIVGLYLFAPPVHGIIVVAYFKS